MEVGHAVECLAGLFESILRDLSIDNRASDFFQHCAARWDSDDSEGLRGIAVAIWCSDWT